MERMTERKVEVLRLVADGMANYEIGRSLFITPETVKTHLRQMSRILGAKNRAHLVSIGYKLGYLKTEEEA